MTDNLDIIISRAKLDLSDLDTKELYEKVKKTSTDNITYLELVNLAAETAIAMSTKHYNYNTIATRIVINNLQDTIKHTFSGCIGLLDDLGILNKDFVNFVNIHRTQLDEYIKPERDFLLDYFGYKTLEKAYLHKVDNNIVETPQYMFMRVATVIHLGNIDAVLQTYDDLSQKYYIHATPTLFNSGMRHQQLSSCYLVAMKDDSIDGIYETLKECAQISKWAGGIGVHIHQIRGKNSKIRSNNGTSDGIVPMLKVFNDTARYCNQAGKRPGSIAVYIEPWHCDIEAFIDLKKNHGNEDERARDLFYALWIPDLFMKRVEEKGDWYLMCPNECPGLQDVHSGEFETLYNSYVSANKYRKCIPARELWTKILHSQIETGTPYMLYKDSANNKSNQKHLGTIKSSNLCVAPETLILTDKGHIEIKDICNQKINVWNGEEFSEVEIKKTGENQELIDVYTNDGCKLTCTKYHKFYIQNSYNKKVVKTVEAQDLQVNDRIIKCNYPVIDGLETMPYPYTHGFFCGDGTYGNIIKKHEPERCNFKSLEGKYFCKRHLDNETEFNKDKLYTTCTDKIYCNAFSYSKRPKIFLYGEKKKLKEYITYRTISESSNRLNLELPLDIEDKFFVPMNHTIKTKMEWLAGLCDADGCISRNGQNNQLQLASINIDFLKNIKYMLQTCGINSKIKNGYKSRSVSLPDGKNGYKLYNCKEIYRLLITSNDLLHLVNIGFSPKRLVINSAHTPDREASSYIKISKIVNNNRIDDTYCFTEPKKHAGIFNGVLTSQCTEIIEYSTKDETAVCNLASIGLPTYINQKKFDHSVLGEKVRHIVRNLNRVIDINYYPTECAKRSNMRHRPIGIGVQGLADVFMELDMDWETDEARNLNRDIFETIYYYSLLESVEQAKLYGPFETFNGSPSSNGILQFDMWPESTFRPNSNNNYNWDELKEQIKIHGLRNSLLIAPMPTASTSQILGFNECFEPITSNIFTRRTLAGSFVVMNNRLMKDLLDLGLWNEDMKNEIIRNDGSVQDISTIPKGLKDKYKTVWEIKQKTLIDMSADRGRYICQSQSLNLYLPKIDINRLGSMHLYAWKQGLKTGLYYLRIKPVAKTQQFTVEPVALTNNVVDKKEETAPKEEPVLVCKREAGCITCSS